MEREPEGTARRIAWQALVAATDAAAEEVAMSRPVRCDRLRAAIFAEILDATPAALREYMDSAHAGMLNAALQTYLSAMRLAGIRAARSVLESAN